MKFTINLVISDMNGGVVTTLTDREYTYASYTLSKNNVHSLVFNMQRCGAATIIRKFFRVTVVYKSLNCGKGKIEGDTDFVIRKINVVDSSDGTLYRFTAQSVDYMLEKRAVPWYTNTPETKKELPADDMLKEIFSEQFIGEKAIAPVLLLAEKDGVDFTADYAKARDSSRMFEVEPQTGAGVVVEKQFGWQKDLMYLFQGIADDHKEKGGDSLFFNIVRSDNENGPPYMFKTWLGVRGADRTEFVVSRKNGTLEDSELVEDYTQTVTACWSAGRGEEDNRAFSYHMDLGRATEHPLGYEEVIHDARNASDLELAHEARRRVGEGREVILLNATLNSEHYNSLYGWGDRLAYVVEGSGGEPHYGHALVNTVTVELGKNQTRPNARVQSQSRIIIRVRDEKISGLDEGAG